MKRHVFQVVLLVLAASCVGAFAAAPANDNFAARQTLSGSPATTAGTNVDATKQANEPNHAGDVGGASVWYTWTAPVAGNVNINTSGSTFDTTLAVYTGTLGALTLISANDDGPQDSTSSVTFAAAAGTVYQIAVDGFGGGGRALTGSITLSILIILPPVNDNFASAIVLSGALPLRSTGSSANSTIEIGETSLYGNGAGSIWWTWTAPASGPIAFSTAGSDFDTLLGVYSGTTLALQTLIRQNDQAESLSTSQVTFQAVAGTRYNFQVDGFFGETGNVNVSLSSAVFATNDNFASAQALPIVLPFTVTGSNVFSSKEPGEPDHNTDAGGHSIWFKVTPPVNAQVVLLAGNSGFTTLIGVYTGSAVNALTLVSSGEDIATAALIAGTTYFIAIDGVSGDSGNVELTVFSAPANDNFANATTLSGAFPLVATGTLLGSTKEVGEPAHAALAGNTSVWYKFTSATAQTITLSTGGSIVNTMLAVYTGSSVGALTPVASSNTYGDGPSGQVVIALAAGTDYSIAVAAPGTASGIYTLTLSPPPANDDFSKAIVLTGTLPLISSSTNVGATIEAAEPLQAAGNNPHATIWWSFTAQSSESLVVTTNGSTFNTLLTVATGNTLATLVLVGDNDDFIGSSSAVTFDARAGTTYRFAVDGINNGKGAENGTVTLAIRKNVPPDLTIDKIVNTPLVPTPGQGVSFTITVRNTGLLDAGPFRLAFFKNLATAPLKTSIADISELVSGIAPLATLDVTILFTAPVEGDYKAWAFVDKNTAVDESDETNNAGPLNGFAWKVRPPPSAVNSPSSASGTAGSAFNYAITATNSPTTFAATGLPAGLSLATATGLITGTPTVDGLFPVTLTATNSGGSGTLALALVIAPAPPPIPAITSPLAATAIEGQDFTYTIAVTGGATITANSIPPGMVLSGNTLSGRPTMPGHYQVTLTAQNVSGTSQSVIEIVVGSNADFDGDGFPNSMEMKLGTDPNLASSLPFSGAGLVPKLMGLSKFALKLSFSASPKDSLTVNGFFEGTEVAGQTLTLDVGGIAEEFVLDLKGKSPKANNTLNAVTKNGQVQFKASFKKADFSDEVIDEGLIDSDLKSTLKSIVVTVLYKDQIYTKEQFVEYTGRRSRSGSTRAVSLEKAGNARLGSVGQ